MSPRFHSVFAGVPGILIAMNSAPATADDPGDRLGTPVHLSTDIEARTTPPRIQSLGSQSVRLAVADDDVPAATNTQRETANASKLEEITVTAEKRSERLYEVPVPVTAVGTDTLVANGLVQMKDYYALFPGMNYSASGSGGFYPNGGTIAIRGLYTGAGDATVSTLIDDVPFGPTHVGYYIAGVPDIDPGDLDHIEVLRGPQGALYGAGSMGGLVKYVTADPSMHEVAGRLELTGNDIYNGNQLGYEARGSINVPVSNTLGVRLSGFDRLTPGYVDSPALFRDGINKEKAYGGRLAALWKPSESFSLKLSALLQDTHALGSPEVDAGLADLQQERAPNTGWSKQKIQLYSATATAKLGVVDLTSVTAYSRLATQQTVDFTFFVPTWVLPSSQHTNKITQELRLSLPLGSRIDWLVGAFYNHEDILEEEHSADALTGEITPFESLYIPIIYSEYAAFTDFTFHLTDRFDIQLGGRATSLTQTRKDVSPAIRTTDHPLTYLVTPRLKLSENLMAYARFASGYRAGGGNPAVSVDVGAPSTYKPDFTKTYDLGVKGVFLDGKLSVDATLYYIDWKDIQLLFLASNNFDYTANGSAAKSEGVELAVDTRPATGLTLSGWIDYDEAVITKAAPPNSTVALNPGDRLPFSPRFSANLSATQEFPVSDRWTGLVSARASYVGNRASSIGSLAGSAGIWPSYTKVDLRAAIKDASWSFSLFVNNVADERGVVGGGPGTLNPDATYYIQPRTVGLSGVRSF
jgi:iron complex outermembrane recepter protein